MFFVQESSGHTIVYVTDDKDDAERVHEWYEANKITAYHRNASLYYVKEVFPNPSPLTNQPNFACGSRVIDTQTYTSVSPTWEGATTLTSERAIVKRYGGGTFEDVYWRQVIAASTAHEAKAIFEKNIAQAGD